MRDKWRSKKQEIIDDTIGIILGIALLVSLTFFNPISFVYSVFIAIIGLFLVAIGTIGLFVDIKITEKKIEKGVWWQTYLPILLGILLVNPGVFYAASIGQFPSNNYLIISISIGIFLLILTLSYNVWRKYRMYLKDKQL